MTAGSQRNDKVTWNSKKKKKLNLGGKSFKSVNLSSEWKSKILELLSLSFIASFMYLMSFCVCVCIFCKYPFHEILTKWLISFVVCYCSFFLVCFSHNSICTINQMHLTVRKQLFYFAYRMHCNVLMSSMMAQGLNYENRSYKVRWFNKYFMRGKTVKSFQIMPFTLI